MIKPGYYWVRRVNKDGEPIGEARVAELRASYVTWPWRSMGGENYGHDDIQIIARILPPEDPE